MSGPKTRVNDAHYQTLRADLAMIAATCRIRMDAISELAAKASDEFAFNEIGEYSSQTGESLHGWIHRLQTTAAFFFLDAPAPPKRRVNLGQPGDGRVSERLAYGNEGVKQWMN